MKVEEVFCDVCGKSCRSYRYEDPQYATLYAKWGYPSRYDGEEHETIICCECYDKLPIPKVVVSDIMALNDQKFPYNIPVSKDVT